MVGGYFLSLLFLPIQAPMSPNLAKALNNPALREASYTLPDGTIVIDPKKRASSPNLAAALQNPYLKNASYTLPDGTIIIDPRKPVSPNLSSALQNPTLRNASYMLPEGTVVTDPNAPISPHLATVSHEFTYFALYVPPQSPNSFLFSCVLISFLCSSTSSYIPSLSLWGTAISYKLHWFM